MRQEVLLGRDNNKLRGRDQGANLGRNLSIETRTSYRLGTNRSFQGGILEISISRVDRAKTRTENSRISGMLAKGASQGAVMLRTLTLTSLTNLIKARHSRSRVRGIVSKKRISLDSHSPTPARVRRIWEDRPRIRPVGRIRRIICLVKFCWAGTWA